MLARAFSTAAAGTKVFNRAVKRVQRNAAARSPDAALYDYLREATAEMIADRITVRVLALRARQDITRTFPVAADLGAGAGHVLRSLRGAGDIKTMYMVDSSANALRRSGEGLSSVVDGVEVVRIVGDEEWPPLAPASCDLVVSNLALHWVNDLPGALSRSQIRDCLKPDGVFLASMIGAESLYELRSSLLAAELERTGGVAPRISPMIQISDAGNLLTAAGFALPTIDQDTIEVRYDTAFDLMEHLHGMGEQAAPARPTRPLSRSTLLAAAATYDAVYRAESGGEGIPATFQIVFMIGWRPHESQPKPLARGSVPKGFGERPKLASA